MPAEKPSSAIALLDLNNAERKLLTQLPGVTKDVAYRIVNHRKHHGGFGDWEDVAQATGFDADRMNTLKARAFLGARPEPESHERQVISRWKGKTDDELHNHG
jgi:DNA uptake protein ComE-like DNA-binding protein